MRKIYQMTFSKYNAKQVKAEFIKKKCYDFDPVHKTDKVWLLSITCIIG